MYGEPSSPPVPLSPTNFALALALHAAVFLFFFFISLAMRHAAPTIIPIDMTIVVNENLDKPEDDLPPSPTPDPPEPPKVEPPKPVVEPPKPVVEPPKPVKIETPKLTVKEDAVIKLPEKKKPEKFEKGKLVKQPDKPKPFEKGTLVKTPPRQQPDFSRLPPARHGNGPRTEKRMSQAEIEKWLSLGARPGTRNQLPDSEVSRCFSLIKDKFYEAWDQPPWTDALQPAQLEVKFGPGGRILGYRLTKSSGDREADQSILRAAARVSSVPGLSAGFIQDHPVLTVVFEVKPE